MIYNIKYTEVQKVHIGSKYFFLNKNFFVAKKKLKNNKPTGKSSVPVPCVPFFDISHW